MATFSKSVKTGVVIAFLCMGALPAGAQRLSMWIDDQMIDCDVYHESLYIPFVVYLFVEPGDEGVIAAEYRLDLLPGHIMTSFEQAPFVSVAVGSWTGPPGISIGFSECQTENSWFGRLSMLSTDLAEGCYFFEPHDESGRRVVAICADPQPLVNALMGRRFCYNTSCFF